MTRDEIIRMARSAGAFPELSETPDKDVNFLRYFAALVAAREREAIALMIERIDLTGLNDWPDWQRFIAELLGTTAELIRARGQE
jgi:hypothetical protein